MTCGLLHFIYLYLSSSHCKSKICQKVLNKKENNNLTNYLICQLCISKDIVEK